MTYFVAEVSSNHNRDLGRCLDFVDVSAAIGCNAVKFQLFKIDDLFAPEILAVSEMHRSRRAWELPVSYLAPIYERCQQRGIDFSCTPFYLDAVNELLPFVSFYKIASYELMWDDLLIACARTGKPVTLSTGMAIMPEIRHAVETLTQAGCSDLTLLHCTSAYPTPPTDCNLAAIQTIREEMGVKVGWSDHSNSLGVVSRAVHRWGASMVEFHVDLPDKAGKEFYFGHCWTTDEAQQMIKTIRLGESADGNGIKEPTESELPDREWRADMTDGLRPLKSIRYTWRPQL